MLAGTPHQARWVKPEPRRELTAREMQCILRQAGMDERVRGVEPLAGGLRNANFKLRLEGSAEAFVLRLYEHDLSICQKEIDVIGLIRRTVPVPEIVYAEPCGWDGLPPFAVFRAVEGISFRDLKRSSDGRAIAQAAYSAGEALARVSRIEFSEPGWLAPGPRVIPMAEQKPDPLPAFVDACLATPNVQRRMNARLRELTRAVIWRWAPRLRFLNDEAHVVHGDFGKRNLIVRRYADKWAVAAVLDWEFAYSGSPLADVGEFLRYGRSTEPSIEPHFSMGYVAADGELPEDWLHTARLIDLTRLCESLTRDYLPEEFVPELVELIAGTVEDRVS